MTTRSHIGADVVVIGAGVIGCAIAARLATTRASVCVIERRHDVADETSKSNTGVTDCGWECEPETLESRLVRASSKRWEEICDRLDVPFHRCGALSLARSDEDLARLDGIVERAARNGVDVRRLDADEVRRAAPYVTPAARGAIDVPEEGVIDSIRLTIAYAELAAANGATFRFSDPLIGAERDRDTILAVNTPTASIRTRFVVNAAGLGADVVSRILGGEEFAIWPRRGEYLLLDREASGTIDRVITQIPTEHTRGVMVVPSTHGSVLLGPTAEDDEDKGDRSTHDDVLDRVFTECKGLVPGIDRRQVIKSFAGLRPAAERTYRVERSGEVRNLIQACAIRSTGVSASWGAGEYVAELLAEEGLDRNPRPDAVTRLRHRSRLRDLEDPAELATDPLACTVVCACEKVTAREIHDALSEPLPARSIAGIAKRTRATWGRCQGAACLSGVSFVASMHLDGEAWELPLGEPGATLGVGATHG